MGDENSMTCVCGREGSLKLADKTLCRSCFIGQIERRFRKTLGEKPLQKDEKVLVVGQLAADVFKRIVTMPLHATFSDRIQQGYGRVVIEWTMDDECVAFLEQMGGNWGFAADTHVKLFRSCRDTEIATYAQLREIVFVPREKNKEWNVFLAAFDDHPDMMYNLLKNVEGIKKMQISKSNI